MSSRDKKLAVLYQLSQEAEPVSMSELLEKLGEDYTERSVRRWLTQMVKEGLVEKAGTRRGTKYKIIHRDSRHIGSTSSCFGAESAKVIEQVRRPVFERNPVAYAEEWFNAYQPNTTFYIPLHFRLQLHKAGKRSKGEDLEVTRQTICTLHYLLSDGLVEPQYAGKVRDHGVRIGGSTYIPYEDPKHLQNQLERITQKAALIEDPYEQSLFLLIHITYLQCFSDVNKRTARLSSNIPLIKHNLVPLSFNDVERDDYTSAVIAIYEFQNIHPILDLYIFSYMRTCAMYDSTVKAMGFDEIRARYRQQRRALIRDIILNKRTGEEMREYISSQISKLVAREDQEAFFGDVLEDLKLLDEIRIAGLGVTTDELKAWRQVGL